jgi:hypothetical protein
MARQRLKMMGFRRRQEGFDAGKFKSGGEWRILENRYSFLFWTLILEEAELKEENYLSWREGKW